MAAISKPTAPRVLAPSRRRFAFAQRKRSDNAMERTRSLCKAGGCTSIRGGSGDEGNGAQGRNRTTDTAIFSRMLYQLSYLGTPPLNARRGR